MVKVRLKGDGKFNKGNSKWVRPYVKEHPSDELKVKIILDEKIVGKRIIALEAKIEPKKIQITYS